MTAIRPDEQAIFEVARKIDAREAREAYLQQICGDDAAIEQRVRALLKAYEESASFLESPAAAPAGATEAPAPAEAAGTVIGPYKVLQPIGEGGMGTVYMAEQTRPVRRTVALKLIKAGLDSRQVLARFGAERQALALMDHPNIAKVLDAGATDTGRPYFVMELVKGIPITKFCDVRRLTLRERLELAIPVCQAVQHAHQKGIIHRDIKPSNVLIALYDGKPVPKVIDFGVAKAAGPRLTDLTLHTEFGAVVGTLEYMSPEQAELNQLDIDTRSDIYSLGVLIYELLTGSTPLERKRLKEAAFLEMLRVIREEESPRPSTRLSTTEELPSIAACRHIEPRKLSGLVRGELDWIVMKALEKDRNRRYETANGLAADLRRYLDDEPVQACPPSAWYRFGKFARRNKAALIAAGLIAGAMLAAVGTLAVSNLMITRERDQKESALLQSRNSAKEANDQRSIADQQRGIAVANETMAKEQELLARRRFYASQINLANQAFQAGSPARTLELLEGLRPRFDEVELRTFEWYYLWRLCHPGKQLNWQSLQQISAVAFSPDGRTVASGGMENIKLWDVATGKQRAVFQQPGTTCLAFSQDGQTLAAGSWQHWESSPRLWDLPSGRGSSPLPGVSAHVDSIAFSHDGKTVAAALHDGRVLFWDLASRQIRSRFQPHTAATSIAFSPDDALLITCSSYGDERMKIWDLSGGEPRMVLDKEGATCIAFSPDGKTIAAGNSLWDVPTGRRKATLPGHRAKILSIAFSPDGKTLATACVDRMVRLFDVATGTELLSHAHGAAVHSLAFSPDGKALATGSGDGKLNLWDMVTGQNPTILPQPAPVSRVDFSKDGLSLVVAGDSYARIISIPDGRELSTLSGFVEPGVLSLDWTFCATWDPDGPVRVLDARTGAEQALLPDQQPKGIARGVLAFSPDGKTLATYVSTFVRSTLGTPSVKLWDLPTRRVGASLHPAVVAGTGGGSFSSMAFSPDGKKLAAGTQFNRVRLWDLASGEELVLQAHLGSWIDSIVFSPDGRTLAAGNDRGTVQLWRMDTGRQLPGSFRGHTDGINGMAFSPDGQTLVTGSDDITVRFWGINTGQERLTLTGHTAAVKTMQFAPDGHTLATAGLDGTVRLWHAAVDEMATACRDELDPADAEGPRAGNEEGDRLRDAGRHAEAANAYQRALVRAEQLGRRSPDVAAYAQELARSHFGLGYLLNQRGAWTEGSDEQRLAIQLLDFAESRLSSGPQLRSEIAHGYFDLATKLHGLHRLPQAEAAYRAAILLYDKLAAEYPTNRSYQVIRANATRRLASLLAATDRSREAVEMYRELLRVEPQDADAQNSLAWVFATCTDASNRDPKRAVELARRTVQLAPNHGDHWNTLGVALYRAGDWKAAIEALTKSMELRKGGDAFDWFFLAMAHWQLGDKPQARSWYEKAVPRMEKNQPKDEELIRFRAEAAALLGLKEKKD